MKANELMIGDWVYGLDENGNKYKCQITELSKYDFYTESSELPEGWENGDSFVEIEPIPLTPEILERNGLYNNYNSETEYEEEYYVNEDGLDIHINGKKFEVRCIDAVNIHLRYVHELQHFLKLCRFDKEIVL